MLNKLHKRLKKTAAAAALSSIENIRNPDVSVLGAFTKGLGTELGALGGAGASMYGYNKLLDQLDLSGSDDAKYRLLGTTLAGLLGYTGGGYLTHKGLNKLTGTKSIGDNAEKLDKLTEQQELIKKLLEQQYYYG